MAGVSRFLLITLWVIGLSGRAFPIEINEKINLVQKSIIVCAEGCDYSNIKSALQASRNGQKIYIKSGTYKESKLIIDKEVILEGELSGKNSRGVPTSIIDGEFKEDVVVIVADNVVIRNLKIINSGRSQLKDLTALRVVERKNVTVENCHLENSFFAMMFEKTEYAKIIGNHIVGPPDADQNIGNGIHIWTANNAVVKDNHIQGQRDGIYFEFVKDSLIEGNVSIKNFRYGLHFMFSDRNEYKFNKFEYNEAGVAVMYSKKTKMHQNTFAKSLGGAAYGLLLKDIYDSEIQDNIFTDNTVGVYMEGSNRSKLSENTFEKNGIAVKLLANCEDNHFDSNRFVSNAFDMTTNGTANYNFFNGNYWDQHSGFDLNNDGFGDVPYKPLRMSSILMEKYDLSFLLMKSFLFELADLGEKVFPNITPETFQDNQPLMMDKKIRK